MGDVEVRGLILGCERTVLGKVWNRKDYWTDSTLAIEPIVVIKKALDKVIADAFKDSGKISIEDIYNYLEGEFGFSPCNLTAFIVGFLLKEYSRDPFRSMDSEGHRESMTPDKLAEMIGNFIGKSNPKATYIVSLTEEEKAFYELTETAWGIKEGACSSPQHAASLILSKMRELSYPVWCLEDIDKHGVFDLVKKYSDLVQCKGDNAHDIANEIGTLCAYIFLIWQCPSQSDNDYPHKDNEIPINLTITPTKITITHKSNEILLATKKRHRGKFLRWRFSVVPWACFSEMHRKKAR